MSGLYSSSINSEVNYYLVNLDKNKNFLKKYFSSTDKFEELYNLYINKKSIDAKSSLSIDLLQSEILHYFRGTDKNKDIVDNIFKFYKFLINRVKKSNNIESNLIFSDNYNFFRDYKTYLSSVDKKEIDEIIYNISNNFELEKLFKKYTSGIKLSGYEYKQLFSEKIYDSKIVIDLFRYVVNLDNVNFYELDFVFNFINKSQSADLEYEEPKIYYTNEPIYFDSNTATIINDRWNDPPGTITAGIATEIGIQFNLNNLKNPRTLGERMFTVLHESKHMNQRYAVNKDFETPESLIRTITSLFYSTYKINYKFDVSEFQANSVAYDSLIELDETINRFGKKFYSEKLQSAHKKLLLTDAYRCFLLDKPYLFDDIVSGRIENILKKDISKKNRVLNKFYDEKGDLRKFDDMAQICHKTKKYKNGIYRYCFPFLTNSLFNSFNGKEVEININKDNLDVINSLKEYEESQLKIMEDNKELFEKQVNFELIEKDSRYSNCIEDLLNVRRERVKKINNIISLISKKEAEKENENKVQQTQNVNKNEEKKETISEFKERIGLFDYSRLSSIIDKKNEQREKSGLKALFYSNEINFSIFCSETPDINKISDYNNQIEKLIKFIDNLDAIIYNYKILFDYSHMSAHEKSMFDSIFAEQLKKMNDFIHECYEFQKRQEKDKIEYVEKFDSTDHRRRY